jgi:hypothetical protein
MNEGNDIIKIAIGVIAVLILVGIVFALIRYASSTRDDAMDNLTSAVGQMDQLKFNAYDNVTVRGAAVTSALYEFDGQPCAIIVQTRATTNPTTNFLAELSAIPTAIESSGDLRGFYKGAFSLDATTHDFSEYRRDFSITKDNRLTSTYIKPTANFRATLIKDENGTTIGIYFEQIST